MTIAVEEDRVLVEGPKGKLGTRLPKGITTEVVDSTLVAHRENDQDTSKALHGLTRSLLANAVLGVSEGFQKELDVVGIGFKAEMKGKSLNLSLGYSHLVEFQVPEGIHIKVERQARAIQNYVFTIAVSGIDKQGVGQVAADIRSLRLPDSYKGKGIRYKGETVKLKVGKKGV